MTRLVTFGSTFDLDSNGNLAALTAALAPYFTLTPVAPVVVVPPPPPPPPVATNVPLLVVISQNGQEPSWKQDYSYTVSDVDDTTDPGDGNPNCVRVNVTGRWGGYQPSNTAPATTDFSKCKYIAISLKATMENQVWSLQFLQAGDKNIPGSGVRLGGADATYGPKSVVGVWQRYLVPVSLLMVDHSVSPPKDVSPTIYKGAVQDQTGNLSNLFYVDNWGGV